MIKQQYANAIAFAGISLTTLSFMKGAQGLAFWLLSGSVVMLLTAAVFELVSE